jgi:hypothetical protein
LSGYIPVYPVARTQKVAEEWIQKSELTQIETSPLKKHSIIASLVPLMLA